MQKAGFKLEADSVVVPTQCTLMDGEIYMKDGIDSAFCPVYRAGDSGWSMAEKTDELEAGLQNVRDMKAAGTAEAWLKQREALRLQLGQITFVVARKPYDNL
eukprot:gnl/TRDRNA2_/TRDRNA2_173766_c1_seq1.p1 gnl/TRDRNA2_/TRDRNA2_173766_c1~~gnl/TRDRNA2_/TRDRNA2_173766_c1_seq1.p1  ORF type:complete len:102 (+),score=28.38 gnl/TRDRNA2_/TRDRNA2_173766_c1_seq1:1-306(+)